MKKQSVITRAGGRTTQRRWLGFNEELGLYTRPDPKYVTSEAREEWPGLALAVQEALVEMNLEQDRGNVIPAKIVKALLGCGDFFNCNLDARSEEEAGL